MGRTLTLLFGLICYLLFLGVFLYVIGFLGGFAVPKTIDSGPVASLGETLAVDLLLIALFGVSHSVMARGWFKTWWTRLVPAAVERSVYVLVTSLVLSLIMWQWRPLPDHVWHVEAPVGRYLLWGGYALGWTITLLSTHLINHYELFGLQQVFYSWRGKDAPAPQFRQPLLYKLVRHPLVLGMVIAFWSVPTMSIGHVLFSAGMTVYALVGLQLEERDLVRAFGDTYRDYQRATPMLIPMPPRSGSRAEASE